MRIDRNDWFKATFLSWLVQDDGQKFARTLFGKIEKLSNHYEHMVDIRVTEGVFTVISVPGCKLLKIPLNGNGFIDLLKCLGYRISLERNGERSPNERLLRVSWGRAL